MGVRRGEGEGREGRERREERTPSENTCFRAAVNHKREWRNRTQRAAEGWINRCGETLRCQRPTSETSRNSSIDEAPTHPTCLSTNLLLLFLFLFVLLLLRLSSSFLSSLFGASYNYSSPLHLLSFNIEPIACT